MPVPGQPRNPHGELADRFRGRPHVVIPDAGRSPGTMEMTLRGCVLAAGQVRRFYRQSVNLIIPQAPYSWSRLAPAPGRAEFGPETGVIGVTRALRYMARSFYLPAGADSTRLSELHTRVSPKVRSKPVTIAGGSKRSMPTVRNRLTSFGSRVEPINSRSPSAQGPDN